MSDKAPKVSLGVALLMGVAITGLFVAAAFYPTHTAAGVVGIVIGWKLRSWTRSLPDPDAPPEEEPDEDVRGGPD